MSMGMAVVMVVTAMLVMVMVIVVMMVVMIMRCGVIVQRMIVRRVAVRLACQGMRMTIAGIGATFGIERRLDFDHARSQPFDHRLDDVIAPDPQAFRHDLRRQMTIAEVPGDPNQVMRVGALDLDQRLRRGDDLNQPTIVQHQRVPASQHNGAFQIEQKFHTARAGHRHPPPVAIVEIEHDGIGRRLRPAMVAPDLRRAYHAKILSSINGRRPLPA
jgi:hypothetical protein